MFSSFCIQVLPRSKTKFETVVIVTFRIQSSFFLQKLKKKNEKEKKLVASETRRKKGGESDVILDAELASFFCSNGSCNQRPIHTNRRLSCPCTNLRHLCILLHIDRKTWGKSPPTVRYTTRASLGQSEGNFLVDPRISVLDRLWWWQPRQRPKGKRSSFRSCLLRVIPMSRCGEKIKSIGSREK